MSDCLRGKRRLSKIEKEILSEGTMENTLILLETIQISLLYIRDCDTKGIPHPSGKWSSEYARELREARIQYAILRGIKALSR